MFFFMKIRIQIMVGLVAVRRALSAGNGVLSRLDVALGGGRAARLCLVAATAGGRGCKGLVGGGMMVADGVLRRL